MALWFTSLHASYIRPCQIKLVCYNTIIEHNLITNQRFQSCLLTCHIFIYTVWPEILAGRYFGGLLKICHLAEFTLAVEPVLAIMIFIAKWLIERAVNLTGSWASLRSVRTKSMIKCNCNLANRCYAYSELFSSRWSLQWLCTRRLDRLPRVDGQANSSFGVQNSLEKRCPRTQLSMVNSMPTIRLARLAAA